MFKILISTAMILFSCLAQGKSTPLYQVDLIVFTHQNASSLLNELNEAAPNTLQGIPLRTEAKSNVPYHLLPSSASKLRQEYWALNRKPQYHVLLHYSWLQPFNNQQAVLLPKLSKDGWQLEGSIRIRRSNYYLLDTNLLFSTASNDASFAFVQKQRLKGGSIYYLDNPHAGVLIKVHQVS
ncbi:CsiV family protein [Legionella cardiaca]|uniref:CsiV family protein n=1 Tax=Legionella cardiaca TaxID=1071983 RepID=A0ABY8ANG6_9GAMM|nr:CsiV family protein [Legionella cardiaca]WED42244.1 CsiV family protein [Legionella cardiaca]